MKRLPAIVISLACLYPITAITHELPSLGDASSAIVSPEQEHLLGRAWLSLLRGQVRQLSDPLLKDFVESSVFRLAETSELADRRLEFVLLDSNQLNAFAAPGGIIGVNGGLFLYAEQEGEFASVLAHELAHLSQRHFARGLEAQQRMQLPVMAALLAGIVAAAAGAGDAGMAAIMSAQGAAIQAQTRFSRQNEQEADRIGLMNLQRAGFDPHTMPAMFERLMRQYRYDRKPPEFLMTHPVSESRIADTRNRAEQLASGGRQDSLRYQLMRARVQLHYENTSGLAAKRFQAQLDENPKHDAARYGLALALIKGGQFNNARPHLDNLLAKRAHEVAYNLAYIELDMATRKLADARQRMNRLLELYPRSTPTRLLHATLLHREGKLTEAESVYTELSQSRPKDPDIWYELAEIRGLAGNTIGLHQARAEYFALVGDYEPAIEQLDFAKRRASNNFQLAARIDARQKDLRNEQQMVKALLK